MLFDWLLPGVLLLGILVFLHEFGHFLVAKALRVPVFRFSLGFGPRIVGFRRGETNYQISLLPLGGYVSMAEEVRGADGQTELVDRFSEQPWGKRALIALAGPTANLITGMLAVIAAALVGVHYPDYPPVLGPVVPGSAAQRYGAVEGTRILAVNGEPVRSYQDFAAHAGKAPAGRDLRLRIERPGEAAREFAIPPAERDAFLEGLAPVDPGTRLGSVTLGMAAYAAGLEEGDRILAIEGRPVHLWREMSAVITRNAGRPLRFDVQRGARSFAASITPQLPPTPGGWEGGKIGVGPYLSASYVVRATLPEALRAVVPNSLDVIRQTFAGLWAVFTRPRQSASGLGGPQMIMQVAGESAKRGAGEFIYILAVISFAIMAFNLLPLPMLDGSHVFLAGIEALRRRPPSETFTMVYQRVGLVLIGSFLIFVLYNDLSRSWQRRAAVSRTNQTPTGEVERSR